MQECILDTGGDRLLIDEGVASQPGIRSIAKRLALVSDFDISDDEAGQII